MLLALLALSLVTAVLGADAFLRATGRLRGRLGTRPAEPSDPLAVYDPGRERRAEQRARELLKSCVNEEEWAMYRDLGFIRVAGRKLPVGRTQAAEPAYAYLVYPHKPIVAYVPVSGRLLSEYCVEFPDVGASGSTRLPASDDVLAKWMALTSDEGRVIGESNMHLVGRQLDPGRVRKDIWRLSEWERLRAGRPARASA